MRVTRLSGAAFSEGIQTVMLDGAPVRVYNLAKMITDCFKMRSKVGLDVALEALREAWQARKVKWTEPQRRAAALVDQHHVRGDAQVRSARPARHPGVDAAPVTREEGSVGLAGMVRRWAA